MELEQSLTTKVGELKSIIGGKLTPVKIPEEIQLFHAGQELTSDLKTLKDYNFKEGSKIILTKKSLFMDEYTEMY